MDRGTMPDDNVGDGSLGGIWSAPPAPPRRPVIVIEAGHLPEAATEAEAALVKSGLVLLSRKIELPPNQRRFVKDGDSCPSQRGNHGSPGE
jgi:hypothetical protein